MFLWSIPLKLFIQKDKQLMNALVKPCLGVYSLPVQVTLINPKGCWDKHKTALFICKGISDDLLTPWGASILDIIRRAEDENARTDLWNLSANKSKTGSKTKTQKSLPLAESGHHGLSNLNTWIATCMSLNAQVRVSLPQGFLLLPMGVRAIQDHPG